MTDIDPVKDPIAPKIPPITNEEKIMLVKFRDQQWQQIVSPRFGKPNEEMAKSIFLTSLTAVYLEGKNRLAKSEEIPAEVVSEAGKDAEVLS